MLSEILLKRPFSFAHLDLFQALLSRDNSAKLVVPIFLLIAGSITYGPRPRDNSDNLQRLVYKQKHNHRLKLSPHLHQQMGHEL